MLVELKLRVKSPVVGNTWNHARQMYVFPRDENAWALDNTEKHVWMGLVENAVESLGEDFDVSVIRWPRRLLLPSLYLLEVQPRRQPLHGRAKVSRHEAIPRNTILTIPIMFRHTDGDNTLPPPDFEQLNRIFTFIGEYEGISPFGSEVGFGLFKVESISAMGRAWPDVGELPEGSKEGADLHDEGTGSGRVQEEDGAQAGPML